MRFHSRDVVSGNLSNSFISPSNFGCVILTRGGLSTGKLFIRIRSFGFDSVGGGINISEQRVSSVTSEREGGEDTRSDLLFRERDQISGGDFLKSFQTSRGGESPTRSTLSLIFNGGNGSFGNPIDLIGYVNINVSGFVDVFVLVSGDFGKSDVFVFLEGQVSEFGHF